MPIIGTNCIAAGRFNVFVKVSTLNITFDGIGLTGFVVDDQSRAGRGPVVERWPDGKEKRMLAWPEGATDLEWYEFNRCCDQLLADAGVSPERRPHPDLWGVPPGPARDAAVQRLLQRLPHLDVYPRRNYL